MASQLIVKPNPAARGGEPLVRVTPDSAGWAYVGFEAVRLGAGETLRRETGPNEWCVVILSGKADVATRLQRWNAIGQRMSVFEKIPPYSVYVPDGEIVEITALTDLEIGICSAPGRGGRVARLIPPEEVGVEVRGKGNTERLIHNILPESQPADSLLVVEVFTPEGNWSSYPPHKHDRDALPEESLLEETYYYRIDPAHGFAVQRVYSDDESLNETLAVGDGEVVLVPRGYHPVSAPPGYQVYYLNVMAGPVRTWKFRNDPKHEWILSR
jgi:5-deoxy-glucuronate isomerase